MIALSSSLIRELRGGWFWKVKPTSPTRTMTAPCGARGQAATGRSNPHEFVQFGRCYALIEETELPCISHLAYSVEKAGHCGAIE